MRYFKMFQRRNQIFDFVKYDNIPEHMFDEGSEESCWITIPEGEAIITDPNASMILRDPEYPAGLYFFEEKYYPYFKDYGNYIREVFPLTGYPWYPHTERGLVDFGNGSLPCFKAAKIHVGPVMTVEEFEKTLDQEILYRPENSNGD